MALCGLQEDNIKTKALIKNKKKERIYEKFVWLVDISLPLSMSAIKI